MHSFLYGAAALGLLFGFAGIVRGQDSKSTKGAESAKKAEAAEAGKKAEAVKAAATAKAADASTAARQLAERVSAYAGGAKAFGSLRSLAFHETRKQVMRRGIATHKSLWVIAPSLHRVRWELPAAIADTPQPRTRAVRREIMVLDTKAKSRRNLITVPDIRRPRVSLWGNWQRVRRFVFLPFVVLESGVKHRIAAAKEGDDPKTQRLRVVWPKTRNYEWVDEHELIVHAKSGRILRVIEITGRRGERRTASSILRWQKVGKLRFPSVFELESGRGASVTLSQLHADLALPKNVWSSKERLIEHLVKKADAEQKARRKKPEQSEAKRKGP